MARRKLAHPIPAEQVRAALDYDPETGTLCWKHRPDMPFLWNCRYATKAAGSLHPVSGYVNITLNGVKYRAHRLAWVIETGAWPDGEVDHWDGNRSNNAFGNLRDATHQQNSFNQKPAKGCISGLKGARFHKHTGRYQASITVSGKSQYIGLFDTAEEAHVAYTEAALRLHGEFARTA